MLGILRHSVLKITDCWKIMRLKISCCRRNTVMKRSNGHWMRWVLRLTPHRFRLCRWKVRLYGSIIPSRGCAQTAILIFLCTRTIWTGQRSALNGIFLMNSRALTMLCLFQKAENILNCSTHFWRAMTPRHRCLKACGKCLQHGWISVRYGRWDAVFLSYCTHGKAFWKRRLRNPSVYRYMGFESQGGVR